MPSSASQTTFISIPQLRADLNGRVIAPEDDEYDEARTIFPGGIDRRPSVIARPADATDVAHVVSLARDSGQELARASSSARELLFVSRAIDGNYNRFHPEG